MKIHIKGGHLLDPASGMDQPADVFVAAGRITAIGQMPGGFHANKVIDASGCLVCPGLVDLSVRLREPGLEYKATLESEMLAAASGGVTSLAIPPDTDPPLDEPGLVEMLKFRARNLPGPRVYPVGAHTQKLGGETLTEMAELKEAGCIAFSQAEASIADNQILLRALDYAATFDIPVWLRPQDTNLSRGGVAHDGPVASRLGLPGIPAMAETVAISTILMLARHTGVRLHLARLSTREGVDLVRIAKQQGLKVTCDVSANHLHLSEMDLTRFDSNLYFMPPVRSQRDREGLIAGLIDGTIDAICSDHAPVDDNEKQLPFGEAAPGASGVELLLPLTLKWAQENGVAMIDAIDRVTRRPAQILGIANGRLAVNAHADICVFDPHGRFTVTTKSLRSQGNNTPFLGYELPGVVRATIIDGHLDYEHN